MRLSTFTLALGAASAVAARQFGYRSVPSLTPRGRAVNSRPDEYWNHIVKGADIVGSGEISALSPEEDSPMLADFSLRAKEVDPSSLGVDKVKQYSGYLDNDAEDKHLFYCERDTLPRSPRSRAAWSQRILTRSPRVLRVAQ